MVMREIAAATEIEGDGRAAAERQPFGGANGLVLPSPFLRRASSKARSFSTHTQSPWPPTGRSCSDVQQNHAKPRQSHGVARS